jgi:hypothetical protein
MNKPVLPFPAHLERCAGLFYCISLSEAAQALAASGVTHKFHPFSKSLGAVQPPDIALCRPTFQKFAGAALLISANPS